MPPMRRMSLFYLFPVYSCVYFGNYPAPCDIHSFGHQVGIHGFTLYRVPDESSTCIERSLPSVTAGGGVLKAAKPTPRRPTSNFDDLNSRSTAPVELVTLIEVDSMLGMLSSVVAASRGLCAV